MKRCICFVLLYLLSGCSHNNSKDKAPCAPIISVAEADSLKEPSISENYLIDIVEEPEEEWYDSVKGHVNPKSLENNEIRRMSIGIYWSPKRGKGVVELVPALKQDSGYYFDIHSNELWESTYEGFGDCMWYLQISCWYKVVEPLYLYYYFNPKFVYEGDLDRDGVPDFGVLLKRHSNLCSYALLTIKNEHWVLMTEPFPVAYNLRASGKELARRGARKGEIIITQSVFDTEDCTFFEANIADSVIVAKRIDICDCL